MTFPKYRAGPVEAWLAGAFTEFVNGFLDGYGGGIGTGAGTGIMTGTTEVGQDMSAINQVWISLAALAAAMTGSGLQAVYVWHKTTRFPNPWAIKTPPDENPGRLPPPAI